MKKMPLSKQQVSMIASALLLRKEACEENNEIIEAKRWEAILIKLGIVKNYGGCLEIK